MADAYSDPDDTDVIFERAAQHVKHLVPRLTSKQLLDIYAHYKQATVGACATPRPPFYEMQARAKWDAWNHLKTMTCACAKQQYVRIISGLDPDFLTDSVKSDNDKPVKSEGWAVVSSLVNTDAVLKDTEKTVFDYCKEGDLVRLRSVFDANAGILGSKDHDGLGLLHWAADRGNVEVLRFLVQAGADVNMVDGEGQTALHYAASCDYLACVECLLQAGADCAVCDNDGMKAGDLATDPDILKLLLL